MGKYKFSQNRSDEDRAGVQAALQGGDAAAQSLARWMADPGGAAG